MRIPRLGALAVALVMTLAACTSGTGSTPIVTGTSENGEIVVGNTAPPNTPPPPPTCQETTPVIQSGGSIVDFYNEDAGLASVHISQAMFECATKAVVVSDVDLDRVAVAAVLAASIGAPLLISSANATGLLGFETERLAPEQLIAVGDDISMSTPEWTEVVTLAGDTATIAAQINSLTGLVATLPLPADQGVATLVATINALESGTTVTPPPSTTTTTTTTAAGASTTAAPVTAATPAEEIDQVVPSLTAGPGTTGVAVLVDGNTPATALAAFASARASGAMATLIDDRDLRMIPQAARSLRAMPGGIGSIHVFGDIAPDQRWQVDVLRSAEELPGGGFLVLPRTLVALYGHPGNPNLGSLGEQGPAEAAVRARALAATFSNNGAPVMPTFELIASVAAAGPGGDGDYSNEWGSDLIQPWLDVAEQNDIYVVLDLQPGRSDFLSQAKEYEEMLLNPHVGLALDPEWRLGPDQVHLVQTGHVTAAEVNSVVEWLADLVRDNNLPQKVLVLHQFQEQMLRDRDQIYSRPELQLIVQMDGWGSFEAKRATWSLVTAGWETHPWTWGWKNFYSEDTPGGGQTPLELSQLEPTVTFVSYQ